MVCMESENKKIIKVNPKGETGRDEPSLKFSLMCEEWLQGCCVPSGTQVAKVMAGSKKLEGSINATGTLMDFCAFRFSNKKASGQVNLIFKF